MIVNLKYGFCKKYFNRNEPLTSWTFFSRSVLIWKNGGQKWSEVHFYQSNFLQNPYFSSLVSQRFLIAIIISVTSMSLNHFTLSTCKYILQYLLLYAPTVNSYQYQLRSNLEYMYTLFSFRNPQIHTRCFNIIHICILLKEKQSFEKSFDKKMLLVNHYQTDLCSKLWGESQFLPYFLLPCASQPILKRRTRARILKWRIEFRLDVISNPRLTATFCWL